MTTLENKLKHFEEINAEKEAFLSRGGIFVFEYAMIDDEYLLVELQVTEKGIEFSACFDEETSFDGEIVTIHSNRYLLPFDFEYDNGGLDGYLQMIDSNITEGYLLPNNLYKIEE
tara:strand:+ start:685 stop:1029 length:345 start_codon:yes stop_codon:yes gene_type:complete